MYKWRNELEFQAKTKNKILFKGIFHEGGENGKISKIQDSLFKQWDFIGITKNFASTEFQTLLYWLKKFSENRWNRNSLQFD